MKTQTFMINMNDDKIFYFLHVPKTAGTTLINILDDHFDLDTICKEHDWGQLLPKMPKEFTKYKLVKGHFGYGIYRILPRMPVYLTMLRDPIDQIPSMYDQMGRNYLTRYGKTPDKKDTLLEFLRNKRRSAIVANNQSRHIALDLDVVTIAKSLDPSSYDRFVRFVFPEFINPEISDDELLELAKKRLTEFAFFGLVEKFQESLDLLCYTFGWKPIRNIISQNVSSTRLKIKDLSKEELDAIKNCTQVDQSLYSYAQQLFETRYLQMIDDLKKKYYENRFDNMQPQELIYELLEKHYEDTYDNIKPETNSLSYRFDQKLNGTGWYAREFSNDGKTCFRWSGPQTVSTIDFPLQSETDMKIQFQVLTYLDSDVLASLKLMVNDTLIVLKSSHDKLWNNKALFEGFVPKSAINKKKFTRLTFEVSHTVSPTSINPNSTDNRKLGLLFEWIKITR